MPALLIALAALAAIGHVAFCVALGNRWHSTGMPRWFVKWSTRLLYVGLATPLVIAGLAIWDAWPIQLSLDSQPFTLHGFWAYYFVFAAAFGAVHIPLWLLERWHNRRPPSSVHAGESKVIDMERQLGASPARGPRTEVLSRLPFNQLWQLQVADFTLDMPRLPAECEGLSICHLSDFHLCGRIDISYFEEIVRLTNAMQPDLVALTGDICDFARYLDLLAPLLGPLQARLGKYFVLGNHDLRTKDLARLRAAMRESGFVDLGNRYETILGGKILMAGNERPWIKPVPGSELPIETRPEPLKILLSHCPDQIGWARARSFDLMLAGHTHGGQICFPLIGPVVCPSKHGVRYANGFFYEPPTLLHVSRGTASLMPVRLNCPPELTRLVLRSAGDS